MSDGDRPTPEEALQRMADTLGPARRGLLVLGPGRPRFVPDGDALRSAGATVPRGTVVANDDGTIRGMLTADVTFPAPAPNQDRHSCLAYEATCPGCAFELAEYRAQQATQLQPPAATNLRLATPYTCPPGPKDHLCSSCGDRPRAASGLECYRCSAEHEQSEREAGTRMDPEIKARLQ